jgi:glycosyltransferase involved in cell wall biosynthesis
MDTLVSILIPCHNAKEWISQCIQSALDQTYPNKEIVVVDDGSTDGSLDVIRGFGGRIRVETGPNRGSNAARNRLIELSRGSWLSFLDADDFLLPEKIARQMSVVASNPGIDVVYSPIIELIERSGEMHRPSIEDEDLYANYIRWYPFGTIGMLWKKSAVLDVGGWKADQPVCQEHELVLRLIRAGKTFKSLSEPLAVYRKANGWSISRRSPLGTLKQKMALTESLEAYLVDLGQLDEKYCQAIAQARFEAARTAYAYDSGYASDLIQQIYRRHKSFHPRGAAAPFVYRIAFNTLGFRSAEAIAATVRRLR